LGGPPELPSSSSETFTGSSSAPFAGSADRGSAPIQGRTAILSPYELQALPLPSPEEFDELRHLVHNRATRSRIEVAKACLYDSGGSGVTLRSIVVKSLTPEQIDLLKTAKAHLAALQQASSPWEDEHSLRVASASLRFLVVDGNLQRAWKASGIGGPIEVEASCFTVPPGNDVVAFCGGADILPGVPVSLSWGRVELVTKTLNLDSFLQSPCSYLKGTRISRHDLIKYVANTKGGVHYDPAGQSKKSQDAKFNLLRDMEQTGIAGLGIAFNGRNLVHHELASAIKSILGSRQIQRLQAEPFDSTAA
jgi:hypothetical protein